MALTAFVIGGAVIDRLPYFDRARDTLQGLAGPAGMPDDGNVGVAVARAVERFGGGVPFGRDPAAFPSTLVLRPDQRTGRLPVLSIVADEDYLHDPETGIMANMAETGPDWERLSWVSFWENGRLVAGSRAGLRIHGDSTRYRGDPSFRLHFRPMYGASTRVGARMLGPGAGPTGVVVVHVVRYKGHYPNVFVFEIARRLGLPTVVFRPVRVFLNGDDRGVYVLTERVMPDGWGRTYFGDPDFYMYVYKGETKQPSRDAHTRLGEWVAAAAPLTLAAARQRVDVDNLTRHLFTVMFAFTTDWAQGAALLDRDDPEARWFWLHWDMDQSFDLRGIVDIATWQQPVLDLITLAKDTEDLERLGIVTDERNAARHRDDMRRVIFMRLLDDPAYRDFFVRFAVDSLNHLLTADYFDELLARYRHLEESPGVYSRVDLGEYFRRRPDFVRAEIGRAFDLGEPLAVRVEGPGAAYHIDGYDEELPYEGAYYAGQTVVAEVAEADRSRFSHWMLDGRRLAGPEARFRVESDHELRAVFTDAR